MIKIIIPFLCRSKKNSEQIIVNQKTGKPMIIQSKYYREFEQNCGYFLKRYAEHLNYPVNVKVLFYVDTKRKRDLTNLLEAIDDVLVKYQVLEDDNRDIIASHDGSLVLYDKENPRTEIEITKKEGYEQWKKYGKI